MTYNGIDWGQSLISSVPTSILALACLWIADWQRQLAHEKLKQDLFDRRFKVYRSFQQLIAAVHKLVPGADVEEAFEQANHSYAEAQILFGAEVSSQLEILTAREFSLWQRELHPESPAYSDDLEQRKRQIEAQNAHLDELYRLNSLLDELSHLFRPHLQADPRSLGHAHKVREGP